MSAFICVELIACELGQSQARTRRWLKRLNIKPERRMYGRSYYREELDQPMLSQQIRAAQAKSIGHRGGAR